MAPTAAEILARAIDLLEEEPKPGKGPAGPLARKLGLNYNRVYRWLQEGNGPDADGLLVLLEKYGWLNVSETARPPTEEETARLLGSREEIVELLRRLQELTGGLSE